MWRVYEQNGKFYHETDSFAIAANLAGYIRGTYKWVPKSAKQH